MNVRAFHKHPSIYYAYCTKCGAKAADYFSALIAAKAWNQRVDFCTMLGCILGGGFLTFVTKIILTSLGAMWEPFITWISFGIIESFFTLCLVINIINNDYKN